MSWSGWAAVIISGLVYVLTMASMWGALREQIKSMKSDISFLKLNAQSPAERKALSDDLDNRIRNESDRNMDRMLAHERLDVERFGSMKDAIDTQNELLNKILNAVTQGNWQK